MNDSYNVGTGASTADVDNIQGTARETEAAAVEAAADDALHGNDRIMELYKQGKIDYENMINMARDQGDLIKKAQEYHEEMEALSGQQ